MRLSVKLFVLGSLGILVFIVGQMTNWFGAKSPPPLPDPVSNSVNAPEQPLPSTLPPRPGNRTPPLVPVRNPSAGSTTTTTIPGEQPASWESKVDQILSSEGDTTMKAKQFIALIPTLPAAGQVEAAEHAANLLPDDQYADLGKILTDPKTTEAVVDVLLADLLDRPNSVKLPLLLQIARTANHPGQVEAHEDLIFYLDEDFGIDWTTWEQKLAAWLQENPD